MPAPLTDGTILAVAKLFDDAGARQPTHSELDFQINKAGLNEGDPKYQGQTVGKLKRVRSTLYWALENKPSAGAQCIEALLAILRTCGGFREISPNYVGAEPIANAIAAFRAESFTLTSDGQLLAQTLDNLSGIELTVALRSYIRRAKEGVEDAALLVGTGKDLMEATAAHILVERKIPYPPAANFETMLGMAFIAVDLKTPTHPIVAGEAAQCKTERAMFTLALGINTMRNKVGTGHGKPWIPNLTPTEAGASVQFIGTIAEWLLHAHDRKKGP